MATDTHLAIITKALDSCEESGCMEGRAPLIALVRGKPLDPFLCPYDLLTFWHGNAPTICGT